jgi:hypothetical protein
LTLYAHTAATPPFAPIGFERLTAGDVLAEKYAAAGNGDFAARAVVACWDLITQSGWAKAWSTSPRRSACRSRSARTGAGESLTTAPCGW